MVDYRFGCLVGWASRCIKLPFSIQCLSLGICRSTSELISKYKKNFYVEGFWPPAKRRLSQRRFQQIFILQNNGSFRDFIPLAIKRAQVIHANEQKVTQQRSPGSLQIHKLCHHTEDCKHPSSVAVYKKPVISHFSLLAGIALGSFA